MPSLLLVAIAVGMMALFATYLLVSRTPDDRNEALAATPGYDIRPPGADLLWEHETRSIDQIGALRTQIWGITGTEAAYVAFLDAALGEMGWQQVRGRDETMSEGDLFLREYRLRDTRLFVTRVDQPHRLPGGAKTPRRSYAFLSYIRITNLEE